MFQPKNRWGYNYQVLYSSISACFECQPRTVDDVGQMIKRLDAVWCTVLLNWTKGNIFSLTVKRN